MAPRTPVISSDTMSALNDARRRLRHADAIRHAPAVVMLGAVSAEGQTLQVRQYAAKFVCGKASDQEMAQFLAAPGTYFTVINVHNPALSAALRFRKKFTVGLPEEKAGKVSEFFTASLNADETMQIDCGDIYKHMGIAPGTFVEGFVVLQVQPTQRDSTPRPRRVAASRPFTWNEWPGASRSNRSSPALLRRVRLRSPRPECASWP